MDKRVVAFLGAVAGVIVGATGAGFLMRAQAAPPASVVCLPTDAAADAKADAIVKQLHAHDHDQYTPKPAAPIGELPKAKTN